MHQRACLTGVVAVLSVLAQSSSDVPTAHYFEGRRREQPGRGADTVNTDEDDEEAPSWRRETGRAS